jgi:hypothetical protein
MTIHKTVMKKSDHRYVHKTKDELDLKERKFQLKVLLHIEKFYF